MFPLGTVLFPGVYLPLHVFEPRYRVMTRRCLDGGGQFGVVLIERGSEVGGGDVRFSVGTIARIVEAVETDDGRWVLGTVGTRRIRVTRWLPDDPHPRAEVEELEDRALSDGHLASLEAAERVVRHALALKAELEEPAMPFAVELDPEPSIAAWQLAAIAPIGPADQQRLLEQCDPAERLQLLAELAEDQRALLARRLSEG
jgi:Lon protease-like protein